MTSDNLTPADYSPQPNIPGIHSINPDSIKQLDDDLSKVSSDSSRSSPLAESLPPYGREEDTEDDEEEDEEIGVELDEIEHDDPLGTLSEVAADLAVPNVSKSSTPNSQID